MPRLKRTTIGDAAILLWYCPGCECHHHVPCDAGWSWNGSESLPSLTTSVRHSWTFGEAHEPRCCHYFVTNGEIHFCSDSTHALAGKQLPLPELED